MRLELCHYCACRCPTGPSAHNVAQVNDKLSCAIRDSRCCVSNWPPKSCELRVTSFQYHLEITEYCMGVGIKSKKIPGGPGPRFNIKATSYQYRKSYCGDKTILRPSYFHNKIFFTGKMTSLYWIKAQDEFRNKQAAGWTEDNEAHQKTCGRREWVFNLCYGLLIHSKHRYYVSSQFI